MPCNWSLSVLTNSGYKPKHYCQVFNMLLQAVGFEEKTIAVMVTLC